MDLRAGQTRWPGKPYPATWPLSGAGPAHGLLRAGPEAHPAGSAARRPALPLGTAARAAVGAGHVRSPGWRGWPGRVEGVYVCVLGGPITAALAGPAQVAVEPGPGANVLGNWIAIEKLTVSEQSHLRAPIRRLEPARCWPVCAGWPVGRRDGADYPENIIRPVPGRRQRVKQNRALGPGLTPHSC